jgi:AraC family transcriptional regulator, positive regulator of tynA and feaB
MADSATGKPVGPTRPNPLVTVPAHTWSTDATPERDRFAYWREALCQAVFNISIEAPPKDFSARIVARSAGPLRFATSESSGYTVVRTRQDIDTAPADHYSIYLQLRGRAVITQGDEALSFEPDDIAISDGRHPFRADLSVIGKRAFAIVPREMLNRRAPWLRDVPLHKLAGSRRFVDLARHHMMELTADNSTLNEGGMSLLTENLCNLLALASAPEIAPNRLQPELQIEALLAFCRQNLHDAELSPQRVADHLGVSVRTLHMRFSQIGETFGRWIRDSRLDACSVALRDPAQSAAKISEVAYRWGFNDLSHFNKAFRERFGRTPREWRDEPL